MLTPKAQRKLPLKKEPQLNQEKTAQTEQGQQKRVGFFLKKCILGK